MLYQTFDSIKESFGPTNLVSELDDEEYSVRAKRIKN